MKGPQKKWRVAAVATSYDTAFEPVQEQARERANELLATFGCDSRIERVLLILKNDAPPDRAFTTPAQAGLYEAAPEEVTRGDFVVEPLFGAKPREYGRRGLAYLEGIASALERGADVVVAMNLNRKVAAADLHRAFDRLVTSEADVVVGTRAPKDGGAALGAGRLGEAKSRAWRRAAHHAFPELASFSDPNAPVKVMRANAGRYLVQNARETEVCPDVEWLALWRRAGFDIEQVPITWRQRPNSRPPWTQVPKMLVALGRQRRRLNGDVVAPCDASGQAKRSRH